MKKRLGYLILLTSIFLTNFVSAQFLSGYGRFSIQDLLNRTDPQTINLTILFLIFFTVIFLVLMRFSLFKNPYGEPHRGAAGVLSLGISALITFGLYQNGFDLSGIFLDIGFSSGSLSAILPILFLALAILIIWKTNFRTFLMLTGLLLVLLTVFTDVFYTKGFTFIFGLILLLIGFWLWRRSSGGGSFGGMYDSTKKVLKTAYGTKIDFTGGRKAYVDQELLQKEREWLRDQRKEDRDMKKQRKMEKRERTEERQRRQIDAIKRAGGAVGKGAGWFGRKAKDFGAEQWQKEKDVMMERKMRLEEYKRQKAEQKEEQKQIERQQTRRKKQIQRLEKIARKKQHELIRWESLAIRDPKAAQKAEKIRADLNRISEMMRNL